MNNHRKDLYSPELVSVDYFLYTCFEHENTNRIRPQNTDLRWPTALACSADNTPEMVTSSSLEELLEALSQWYLEKSPQLNSNHPLNMENLADIVPMFLSMASDIDTIVKAKTSDYLPSYEDGTQDPVWIAVNQVFNRKFHNLSKMYLRFLHWSHASQPQQIEIDPGSRPPVGRNMPKRARSGGQDGRSSRGGHNAGRRDGNRNNNGNQRSPSPEGRSNRNDRGDRKRSDRNQGKNSGQGSHGNNKGAANSRGRDVKQERESLKEVLIAVQKLNEDTSIEKYSLPPANSYYRRLQHKQIAEEGLFSISEGEGNDRSVVVVRNDPGKSFRED